MEIRARRVVCSPPRLASAVSRCRVCVVNFWRFASGWGSKRVFDVSQLGRHIRGADEVEGDGVAS